MRNDSNKLSKILNRTDKRKSECTNLLSFLFRTILQDLNISDGMFEDQLRKKINDPRTNIPDTKAQKGQYRTNLIKEITKPAMSWLYFERAIRIFRPIRIKLTIELTYSDASTSKHVVQTETEYMRRLSDVATEDEIKKFEESTRKK